MIDDFLVIHVGLFIYFIFIFIHLYINLLIAYWLIYSYIYLLVDCIFRSIFINMCPFIVYFLFTNLWIYFNFYIHSLYFRQ